MQYDLEPGNFVINPSEKEWGIGQVQSSIKEKVTINFENVGKKVINIIKVPIKIIRNRNKKNLYRSQKKNVVGKDIYPEFPKKPNILVKNNFKNNINSIVDEILKKLKKQKIEKKIYIYNKC